MSTAHTPGPWHWESHRLSPVTPNFDASDVYSILDAEGGYGFRGSKTQDTMRELDADRALIAAAPDLLAALQAMLKDAEAVRRVMLAEAGIGMVDETALAAARAAIAKATGSAQ